MLAVLKKFFYPKSLTVDNYRFRHVMHKSSIYGFEKFQIISIGRDFFTIFKILVYFLFSRFVYPNLIKAWKNDTQGYRYR